MAANDVDEFTCDMDLYPNITAPAFDIQNTKGKSRRGSGAMFKCPPSLVHDTNNIICELSDTLRQRASAT